LDMIMKDLTPMLLLSCEKQKGTAMSTPHPLPIDLKSDKSNANLPKWLERRVDACVFKNKSP